MLTRILTALAGIPLFLASVWAGGWWYAAVAALLAGVGYHEYARLLHRSGTAVPDLTGALASAAVVLGTHAWPEGGPGALIALAALGLLARAVFRHGREPVDGALLGIAGLVYAGGLFAHLVLLRDGPRGLGHTVFAFAVTWVADSAAYFTGRAAGRRRLAPALSPGKTVEGAAGGFAAAAVAGALLAGPAGLLPGGAQPAGPARAPAAAALGAGLGAAVAAAALVGDLAESALKRRAGVKDSGRLFPGHGGVLDRFDAALFTVPVVYYVALLLGVAR